MLPPLMHDVDRPEPGHVPHSQRAKEGNDVPPGSHERRRRSVPVAPGVPVAVHLMAEAQNDRATVIADSLSVRSQVCVVPPRRDRGKADTRWVDLNKGYCAMRSYVRGESGLERLKPSAVVHNKLGTEPSRCAESGVPPRTSQATPGP